MILTGVWLTAGDVQEKQTANPPKLPVAPPAEHASCVFSVKRISISYPALSCSAKSPMYNPTLERYRSQEGVKG